MKRFFVFFCLLTLTLLVNSCKDSSSANESVSTADFNGNWNVTLQGIQTQTIPMIIKTTSNTMDFMGYTFKGKYSGNSFNGTLDVSSMVLTLDITRVSSGISGTLKQTVDLMGVKQTVTQTFTGTKTSK